MSDRLSYLAVRADRHGVVATHWDTGDGWTACGLRVRQLDVLAHLVAVELPYDGCSRCESSAGAPAAPAAPTVFARPMPGRLRRSGRLERGAGSDYTGQTLYCD